MPVILILLNPIHCSNWLYLCFVGMVYSHNHTCVTVQCEVYNDIKLIHVVLHTGRCMACVSVCSRWSYYLLTAVLEYETQLTE